MKHLALAIVACCGLGAATANADPVGHHQPGSFYLPVSFGFYHPNSDTNMKPGPLANIGIGYNLTDVISVQGLLGWFKVQDNDYNTDRNSVLSRAEVLFHWPTGHAFEPYAAAGIGLVHIRSSHFLVDMGFGAEYFVAPNTAMTFNWRYVRQTNNGQGDYLLTGGINFGFGGTQDLGAQGKAPAQKPLTNQQDKMLHHAQTQLKPYLPEGVERCGPQLDPNACGCVTFQGNQMILHMYVQFKQNLATIQPQYHCSINRLASFMSDYPKTNVDLKGYASSEGPKGYNEKLSNWRSQAVKSYLVKKKNISPARLTAVGYGISDPLASNADEQGREMNRRVQASMAVPIKYQKQQ